MPSDEEINAAAVALFQIEWAPALAKGMMPCDHEATMKYWTDSARAALEAAERVRAK